MNAYNFVAPFYDALATLVLGQKFHGSKWAFLDIIQRGDTVLVVGGGTGANLPDILKRCGKEGKVIYMEASEKMLDKAKKRIPLNISGQVEFICRADFKFQEECNFDVIVTQFLLDVLTDQDITALFEEVNQRVTSDSKWLFLDFFPVRDKQFLIRLMITCFGILTQHPRKELPDYAGFFTKGGWVAAKEMSFEKGFYQAKVYLPAPKVIKSDTISLK
ncbi:class I SAM-dependent methyltransferase [Cyclobacterium sp. 1_MG-2023]|uniref:class I SAM-dependent methyltransferase n=1 Tax=Cyclobacterium sp. 1_MG-2023 TaxID=3062681 RepID=UPI0026E348CB|nr:class I SAM-dependent methyltransferase [Cyclobacterium sp. 1_MG-2023]MDO6438854.1 class I SAM-dependent methyltransferase [Cyclobacterium sp. 1_MG-2023]